MWASIDHNGMCIAASVTQSTETHVISDHSSADIVIYVCQTKIVWRNRQIPFSAGAYSIIKLVWF